MAFYDEHFQICNVSKLKNYKHRCIFDTEMNLKDGDEFLEKITY